MTTTQPSTTARRGEKLIRGNIIHRDDDWTHVATSQSSDRYVALPSTALRRVEPRDDDSLDLVFIDASSLVYRVTEQPVLATDLETGDDEGKTATKSVNTIQRFQGLGGVIAGGGLLIVGDVSDETEKEIIDLLIRREEQNGTIAIRFPKKP